MCRFFPLSSSTMNQLPLPPPTSKATPAAAAAASGNASLFRPWDAMAAMQSQLQFSGVTMPSTRLPLPPKLLPPTSTFSSLIEQQQQQQQQAAYAAFLAARMPTFPPIMPSFGSLPPPNSVIPYGVGQRFCLKSEPSNSSIEPILDVVGASEIPDKLSELNESSKKSRPKKFQCPHCQVSFSNNGQLKGHIRIHTGERPFVCDHPNCNKTFTRNEELTRHKRIHTGLRPFLCDVCNKRFGRKDHLKKHIKTHQRPPPMPASLFDPAMAFPPLPILSYAALAAYSSWL